MATKKDKQAPTPEAVAAATVEVASLSEALVDYDSYVQAQAAEVWQFQELPFDLALEDHLFVRSYIIDRNAVAAMRRLGHRADDPKKLKARATRHLAKVEVQSAIEFLAKQMMERLDVTADKVQRQIAAVAFFDPREVMTFDKYGLSLVHSRFWSAEQAAAIKSIKQGANGIEIVMYDRLRANEMLAKQLGTMPDDDTGEATKAGAEAVLAKIDQIVDRLLPDRAPVIPPSVDTEPRRLN